MELKINQKGNDSRIAKLLPTFVMIVFTLQPLMDMLSYLVNKLGTGNTLTLVIRLLVLAVVVLTGFCVSNRKKAYFIAAAVLAVLFAGHAAACVLVGYQDIIGDVTNFIRVVQMPLLVICFITFVKANDKCFEAMENGIIMNFWIITISVVLSVITGTEAHTYIGSGIGVMGWFVFGNAQSAIMSVIVPIVICLYIYRQKNIFIFAISVIAAFLQLYLLGTRLAFFTIIITAIGIVFVMLITKQFSIKHAAILIVCMLLCCAAVKQSPMYLNQTIYTSAMSEKQKDAESMIADVLDEQQEVDRESYLSALRSVYRFYSKNLCARFGVDVVMEKYDYTDNISEITAVRPQKIMFNKLLMDEHPFISHIFGIEYSHVTYRGHVYDVENDFHGIYFLYGAAGLVCMIAFILFFVYLIIKALRKDFKGVFNMQSAGYGMAIVVAIMYAYFTAGMLRRPNASFYLSVVLAIIYCITTLRAVQKNDKTGDEEE